MRSFFLLIVNVLQYFKESIVGVRQWSLMISKYKLNILQQSVSSF